MDEKDKNSYKKSVLKQTDLGQHSVLTQSDLGKKADTPSAKQKPFLKRPLGISILLTSIVAVLVTGIFGIMYWLKFSVSDTQLLAFVSVEGGYEVRGFTQHGLDIKPKEITIPETYDGQSVISIGKNAFLRATSIINVNLPNSIIRINDGAFNMATELQNINLPYGLQYLGANAFITTKITENRSVFIPSSVEYIGSSAFSSATSGIFYIEHYEKPAAWIWTPAEDSVLWGFENDKLITIEGIDYYVNGTEATVMRYFGAGSILSIGESITFNEQIISVTTIATAAFRYTSTIVEAIVPNTITQIGNDTFSNSRNLEKISLPSGMTTIADGMFYYCESLNEITLPQSIMKIGYFSFGYTRKLLTITLPDGLTEIDYNAFNNSGLESITIPISVERIGHYAFSSTSLTIYAQAASAPSGWDSSWHGNQPVIWGHVGD